MRITVVAIGTRGDVQPYIALGLGLQTAGHSVRLATHRSFEPLVREYGLGFFLIRGDPHDLMNTEEGFSILESGGNVLVYLRRLLAAAQPFIESMFLDCWKACEDSEAIIHSLYGSAAVRYAQEYHVPSMGAYLQPVTRTTAFPLLFIPHSVRLGPLFNRFSYVLGEQILWQIFRPFGNKVLRKHLALPPVPLLGPWPTARFDDESHPVIYGYSPSVVPRPADWDEHIHVTGYWFLEKPPIWQPPLELVKFLEDGPPPIYVGFGSMTTRNPQEMTQMVVEALRRTGQRAVLLAGRGTLIPIDMPRQIFSIESVPHDWLFPRMAVVVHHGGAGTTAAGLRAGLPSIVVPFAVDQPFWADRVAALGVGPEPIPKAKFNAEALALAIDTVTRDSVLKARAADLGARIRAECGVAKAIEAFEAYIAAVHRS